MELRPYLSTYDLEWDYDEPLSVHVLETDEATILFGGGAEETAEWHVELIGDHDVDVVLVEHGDGDHFGAIPEMRSRDLEFAVAVPAGDLEALEDAGIEVEYPLEPDETYWGIRTISTPGHTSDNMAYLYEDVLVAGDTVCSADSPFAAPGEWSGRYATIDPDFNADDVQARASVETLLDYEFETVLVSHGENVDVGGKEHVRRLVEDLE